MHNGLKFRDANGVERAVSSSHPLPVSGGGGGSGGDASAANQVTLNTAIGTQADAAWDMVSANASLIAIAKRIALNTSNVVVSG